MPSITFDAATGVVLAEARRHALDVFARAEAEIQLEREMETRQATVLDGGTEHLAAEVRRLTAERDAALGRVRELEVRLTPRSVNDKSCPSADELE